MPLEIESHEALFEYMKEHGRLDGTVIQGLNLLQHSDRLMNVPVKGTVFLGCALESQVLDHIIHGGGVVFPRINGLPYHPYRPRLYTPDELMAGYRHGDWTSFVEDTLDSRIYRHFAAFRQKEGPSSIMEALGQRLHDHAMDDALEELLHNGGTPRKVVGVMGGHAMKRSSTAYRHVAHVGWRLTREGYFIATGGGPGAMEAANLGAWFATRPESDLHTALDLLAPADHYQHPHWFDLAYEVRQAFPYGAASLAIPTWFYGHEPTNLFATQVAKYFSNSIREDTLLAIALHGVIFTPGSAGTIQEVFMEVTQNHYGTFRWVSPMVFLDSDYWTRAKPVFPLLAELASSEQYGHMLALHDHVDDVVRFILEHPPELWGAPKGA